MTIERCRRWSPVRRGPPRRGPARRSAPVSRRPRSVNTRLKWLALIGAACGEQVEAVVVGWMVVDEVLHGAHGRSCRRAAPTPVRRTASGRRGGAGTSPSSGPPSGRPRCRGRPRPSPATGRCRRSPRPTSTRCRRGRRSGRGRRRAAGTRRPTGGACPVGGHGAAVEQAGLGSDERAGADRGRCAGCSAPRHGSSRPTLRRAERSGRPRRRGSTACRFVVRGAGSGDVTICSPLSVVIGVPRSETSVRS